MRDMGALVRQSLPRIAEDCDVADLTRLLRAKSAH